MAYTTPRTWSAGEIVTAANMNSNVRDNVSFLANPPACRVFHNANQSIANNVEATVAFNSERFDTDTMHDTVTNNSRITFNTAGLYEVKFNGDFVVANDYTSTYAYIRLNSTTNIAQWTTHEFTSGTIPPAPTVSTLYKFAAADFVEVRIFQTNGAAVARNLVTTAQHSPEFSAVWVGLG